ncbi:MAG: PIN domain-containing protein, partial [Usitatibacter sp.]
PKVAILDSLLEGDDLVGVAPIILQEVLQGADSSQRFERWRREFTGLMCYLPLDPVDTHIEAARLYAACRRAGNTPRSGNDCLIARIAVEHDVPLLENDRDFEAIAMAEKRLHLLDSP